MKYQFFCQQCARSTHFLPVPQAVDMLNISRSTVYYWMVREWIHWQQLPNGRRVICLQSIETIPEN
jgi:hypothetical protein